MMDWLQSMEYWHWLSLGFALIAAELLMSSGFFLLFIGVGALITGLVMLVMPELSWQVQLVLFGSLSAAALVGWWRYGRVVTADDHPNLNKRGDQHVGKVYTLDTAIENGRGRCHVGDSQWSVRGPDLPAGAQVKVVAVDSTILVVEAAD
jgi:inner membrane protein